MTISITSNASQRVNDQTTVIRVTTADGWPLSKTLPVIFVRVCSLYRVVHVKWSQLQFCW